MNPVNQPLYPDAAQRIMSLMKSTFGLPGSGPFNAYFLGIPNDFIPPQDAFPFLVVDKDSGTYKVGPTTADDITEVINIHILVDIKTGFGAPADDDTVKRQLQTIVEGRDPNTGYLLNPSVMFALRTYITLNSQAVPGVVTINNSIEVMYNSNQATDKLPETREALIRVTADERQMVLNRR